jgi:type 1 glutamine amidotransferase
MIGPTRSRPRPWHASALLAWLLGCAGASPVVEAPGAGAGTLRQAEASARERNVLIVAGPKSHGPEVHEYIKSARLLKVMLDDAPNLRGVRTEVYLNGWPDDPAVLEAADLIVVISDGQDGQLYSPVPFMASPERMRAMERVMEGGAGLMTYHFSTFAPDSLASPMLRWAGGYFRWQDDSGTRNWYSAIRTLETEVVIADAEHPIARGLPAAFELRDEFYYNLRFGRDDPGLRPIVRVPALESDREHGGVVAWAVEREDGRRGFGTSMGHFFSNWSDPHYRRLILNAIVWAAGAEVPHGGVDSRFFTDREVTERLYGASIKALILTGRNHPAHNWELTTPVLRQTLEEDDRVHVDVSYDIEDLHQYDLRDYDLLLLNYANWEDPAGLSDNAKRALVGYLSGGGGLLAVHFANGAFHHSLPGAAESDWPEYRRIVRRVWDHGGGSGHDRYGTFRVDVTDVAHEITAGLTSFETTDELYYDQAGSEPIEPLITARSRVTGRDEPLAWAYSYGDGRVFQTLLGHDTVGLRTPEVGRTLRRAAIWAAGAPQR